MSAAELNRRFGEVRRKISDGIVAITHHGKPTMVLMSADRFRQLSERRQSPDLAAAWRRKLQIILDHIREGYVSIDSDYSVQTINRVGELFVGRTRDELTGIPLEQAFPSIGGRREDFRRVMETGEIRRYEANSQIHPDRRLSVTMIPLPLPTGGVGVLFDNITEQTQARAALAECEDVIATLLGAVDDRIIFSSDGRGRVILWGRGAEAALGWSSSEIAGTAVRELVSADESDHFRLNRRDGSVVEASGTVKAFGKEGESALYVLEPLAR